MAWRKFAEAGTLSLIDQRQAIDVGVCRTDADRVQLEAIKEAWSHSEYETVRELLDETKSARVSVPVYRTDSREAEKIRQLDRVYPDTDLRWVDARCHVDYFDPTFGLLIPETTAEGRFL